MKLNSKRLTRSLSRLRNGGGKCNEGSVRGCGDKRSGITSEVRWELRPGGMLVQRRENGEEGGAEEVITVRVATVSEWHDISIQATSTFGELKNILSVMIKLETKQQRLLFKGKEREDIEYLHMVGVRDNDKVLLVQDPAIKEKQRMGLNKPPSYRTITV